MSAELFGDFQFGVAEIDGDDAGSLAQGAEDDAEADHAAAEDNDGFARGQFGAADGVETDGAGFDQGQIALGDTGDCNHLGGRHDDAAGHGTFALHAHGLVMRAGIDPAGTAGATGAAIEIGQHGYGGAGSKIFDTLP